MYKTTAQVCILRCFIRILDQVLDEPNQVLEGPNQVLEGPNGVLDGPNQVNWV